jgi:hypothetical protein
MAKSTQRRIPAIRVQQWLRPWDRVRFDPSRHRAKPEPHFFIFSLPAAELRSLCGISRRQADTMTPRSADLGIQRQHDPERSHEIGQFVEYGYPWSTLSTAKRDSGRYDDLRKPGWLPTAIVINILTSGDRREGKAVANQDLVAVNPRPGLSELILPYENWSSKWKPKEAPPLEVIDGQHRLWAFESASDLTDPFELPIVAFHGLDISWQAYLFWTINIKPKRINASLAFDLYPLLRAEDWLERAEEHIVYRETRAQELVEALWSYPDSPWYDRINMLGEKNNRWIRQSAWIRGLTTSFVKAWDARAGRVGGLFGERIGAEGDVLRWSRAQQAAFLIYAWQMLRKGINESADEWLDALRRPGGIGKKERPKVEDEPGFYGEHSLIATDQGMRGYLMAVNDICYTLAPRLKLNDWILKPTSGPVQEAAISAALKSLTAEPVAQTVETIAKALSSFDWRTSTAYGLKENERQLKRVFRGSGGYKELRHQLLLHLSKRGGSLAPTAGRLAQR